MIQIAFFIVAHQVKQNESRDVIVQTGCTTYSVSPEQIETNSLTTMLNEVVSKFAANHPTFRGVVYCSIGYGQTFPIANFESEIYQLVDGQCTQPITDQDDLNEIIESGLFKVNFATVNPDNN